jgi:hypothetical protein
MCNQMKMRDAVLVPSKFATLAFCVGVWLRQQIHDVKILWWPIDACLKLRENTAPAEPTVWHARPTFELVRRRQFALKLETPSRQAASAKQDDGDDDDDGVPTTLVSCLPSLDTGSHKI